VQLQKHSNTTCIIPTAAFLRCAGCRYNNKRIGEKRNAYRILVGKPEGKRPLGRPRRRWVDNIKMNLREDGIWIGLIWLRIGTSGGLL
jgi:hypothetical protein